MTYIQPIVPHVIDEILVGALDREPNRGLLRQPIVMELLNDFGLADGVALLAQRSSDMQNKLDDHADRASVTDITINGIKTKSMDVNTANLSSSTVLGKQWRTLKASNILVAKLAAHGGTKIDIGAWIKKTRAAFASLRNVWI